MLREACDLASKNVDEATKLENKGLIAQLVRLPVPLASRREFGRGRERARLGAAHRGGMGTHPVCFSRCTPRVLCASQGAHPVCVPGQHPPGSARFVVLSGTSCARERGRPARGPPSLAQGRRLQPQSYLF